VIAFDGVAVNVTGVPSLPIERKKGSTYLFHNTIFCLSFRESWALSLLPRLNSWWGDSVRVHRHYSRVSNTRVVEMDGVDYHPLYPRF